MSLKSHGTTPANRTDGAAARVLGGRNFEIEVGSGDKIELRQFSVRERLSSLFQVNLIAVSENPSIEFDDVVGQPAKFSMAAGMHARFWSGVCNHFEQVRVEPTGLSTYQFSIVPTMWLLTQRKNHRMFQQISEPDIVLKLLGEWGIAPVVRIDKGAYKKRKYRVQYGESDFTFISRMLEDAGISFFFEQAGDETKLVLSDAPQADAARGATLAFMDDASLINNVSLEFVTGVRIGQRVRPGKYTMRDHDYRKPPAYKLMATASKGLPVEERLERFQYTPGAFLFGSSAGEATPSADDKGKARTDEKEAALLAQKRLDAKRGSARVATFDTNAHDLAPGVVMTMSGHPHAALGEGKSFLIVESSLSGTTRGEWSHHCEARGTEVPFRPELSTPRPKVSGVESATVVGPPGEEIHTDEFGRVRVHFHWDRESKMDDNSSCWIHVSQAWGGSGYGGTNLPRIGQEVLVDFLGGDPDRPVIVGRVYTNLQKTPYKLPQNKTQSGWKSNSTGGGGGYNEIMFEDSAGRELVRVQAEKDLNKLVKHDEQVAIGNDRTKQVGHDDALTVGHDRSRQVGNDEFVQVGNDRTRMVGNNESVTVGNNRSKVVGQNETMTVGLNQSLNVGAAQSVKVGASQTVNVGGAQAVTVAMAAAETIGLAKALTVGAGYQVTVGGAMNTTVGLIQAEEVGLIKTVTVGQKIEITCGAAKLMLEKSGKVTLEGTEFVFKSSGPVGVTGKKITVDGTEIGLGASGKAELSGASVQITGDPIDLN
ncbi:type VI secretion system Vgr family protein [Sorangium sp. So ce1153]|uniref:type VI secretion system Vgr family protein n=1 Tax=Sorangium sp. So ce1153 TaxID=3133333 RepID=UPI003F60A9A4